MRRFFLTCILGLIITAGLWALVNHEQLNNSPQGFLNNTKQRIADFTSFRQGAESGQAYDSGQAYSNQNGYSNYHQPFSAQPGQAGNQGSPFQQISGASLPRTNTSNHIRLASFKINPAGAFNEVNLMADICRRFDLIAFQTEEEAQSQDMPWLTSLMNTLNSQGSFQYFRDEASKNRAGAKLAVVFNSQTLELDQNHYYTVNDPDNLMSQEPLVGWFRTRGVPRDQAFTFSVANLQLDSSKPFMELSHLGELFRAIRADGRGEDDVIIMGDFNAGDQGLQPIQKRAGLTWVISGKPTDTLQTTQCDNLVFNELATIEFGGNGGVFDFMKKYNLRLDHALSVSSRVPVWAEFSNREGVKIPARTNIHSPPVNAPTGGRVAQQNSND